MNLFIVALPGSGLPEVAKTIANEREVRVDWLEIDLTHDGAREDSVHTASTFHHDRAKGGLTMAKKMTAMGTGPATAVPAFVYLVFVIVVDQVFSPRFRMPGTFPVYLPWGVALIVVGLLVLGLSSVQLMRAFKRHELATTGLYAIAPNPMFMSYVVFILPGLALLLRSWLVLTTVVAFYILIRVFARAEDEWLLQEFGERYLEYRKRVLLKFL